MISAYYAEEKDRDKAYELHLVSEPLDEDGRKRLAASRAQPAHQHLCWFSKTSMSGVQRVRTEVAHFEDGACLKVHTIDLGDRTALWVWHAFPEESAVERGSAAESEDAIEVRVRAIAAILEQALRALSRDR